jgi:hypothetical protein
MLRLLAVAALLLASVDRAGAVARHQNVTLSRAGHGANVQLVYAAEGYTAARTLVVPAGTARSYQYLPQAILHDFGTVQLQPHEVSGLRQATFHLPYGAALQSGARVHLVTLFFRGAHQVSVGQHGISGAAHAFGGNNDLTFQLP